MITVNFFNELQHIVNRRQVRLYADEMRVLELLKACETELSTPFLEHVCDDRGALLPGTEILVNGQNIRHLHGVATIVRNGSDVAVFTIFAPENST